MLRRFRPAGGSALAGALFAAATLSCQFPVYRVGESGGGAAGASGGGNATAGGAVGGASPTAGGTMTGGLAGGSGDFPEPVGMALGDSMGEAVWRPSGEGDEFTDACPANQVLIALQGTTDSPPSVVRSVQGSCGEVSIVKRADGTDYEAHITPSLLLPERGAPTSTVQLAGCPTDQLVTGFSGRSGAALDALQIRCASLRIVGSAPNLELLVHGETSGGIIGGKGGSAFDITECSADQVALGQYVRVNGSPNAFGVACATPALILE